MTDREVVLNILKESGAFMEGHFILSSGNHSSAYVQCARLFQYPDKAETVCRHIVGLLGSAHNVDVVVSPAVGGIVFGYEMARLLGKRNVFVERDDEGRFTLRRGFELAAGEKVLIAEDVVTTGGSVEEVADVVSAMGAKVRGVCCVVDRSGGRFSRYPLVSCVSIELPVYAPEDCPLCREGVPAVKPGSRRQ